MKTAAAPSPVSTVVRSVPHIVSTRSVMIVPSCERGPRAAPRRWGASRPCSRISPPQHAAAGGPNAGKAQPRPDLAIALAGEATGADYRSDRRHQVLIAHRADRARTAVARRGWAAMPIHAGASDRWGV